jgi:hypothetical protein
MTASKLRGSTDEVDQLLSAFFKAEKPHSWPAVKVPSASPRPQPRSLVRGRLALAASVAILLGGQAWLLRSYQADEAPATASDPGKTIAHKATKPRKSAIQTAPVKNQLPSSPTLKNGR